jgi:hypothetical protein
LGLFDINKFEISAPKCPTHYYPERNCDVLDNATHSNVRLLDAIISDLPVSVYAAAILHILDHLVVGILRTLLKIYILTFN